MSMVTELVNMKTNGSVSAQEFIKIIDTLERDFHSKQSGFVDTELLYDEKADLWIMIQHWASAKEMKAASSKMFKDSKTEAYRNAIDPKTVKISVYPTLQTWTGAPGKKVTGHCYCSYEQL